VAFRLKLAPVRTVHRRNDRAARVEQPERYVDALLLDAYLEEVIRP